MNKDKIICLDIETTGLDFNTDEILELSIINYDGNILFNNRFKPIKKKEWYFAEQINMISPNDVKNCKTIGDYSSEIIRLINDADTILGFNHKNFDMKFIEKSLNICIDQNKYLDVMNYYVKELVKGIRNGRCKLKEACNDLGIVIENHHSALGDAKATLDLYKKINELKNSKNKIVINKEMYAYKYEVKKDGINIKQCSKELRLIIKNNKNRFRKNLWSVIKKRCNDDKDYKGIAYHIDKYDNDLIKGDYIFGINLDEKSAKQIVIDNLDVLKKTKMINLINNNYFEICNLLLKKYGTVKGNYFNDKKYQYRNLEIGKRGLVIHHIKENEAIFLSNKICAEMYPFEYQMSYNLVYCNMIEHLLLHIKIVMETDGKFGYNGMKLIYKDLHTLFYKKKEPKYIGQDDEISKDEIRSDIYGEVEFRRAAKFFTDCFNSIKDRKRDFDSLKRLYIKATDIYLSNKQRHNIG